MEEIFAGDIPEPAQTTSKAGGWLPMEELAAAGNSNPPGRFPWRRAIIFAITTPIGFGLFSLLFQAVCAAKEAARASQCICNVCQINLAMHNYYEEFDQFPPAYTTDAKGRRLLSWRVLLLPYTQQQPLYEKFHLDEPWNSPHNSALLPLMPNSYVCPSHREASLGYTNYAAITGPGTVFPHSGKVTIDEITDGTHNTMMFAEVCNFNIPWTAPIDLNVRTMSFLIDDPQRPGISSKHPGAAVAVMVDASTFRLHKGISPATIRAMTTIAGGERIDSGNGFTAEVESTRKPVPGH